MYLSKQRQFSDQFSGTLTQTHTHALTKSYNVHPSSAFRGKIVLFVLHPYTIVTRCSRSTTDLPETLEAKLSTDIIIK